MSRARIPIGKPTVCKKCGAKKAYRTEWPFVAGRWVGRIWLFIMPFVVIALGISTLMGNNETTTPYIATISGIPLLISILLMGIGEIMPGEEHRAFKECQTISKEPTKKVNVTFMIMGIGVAAFVMILMASVIVILFTAK